MPDTTSSPRRRSMPDAVLVQLVLDRQSPTPLNRQLYLRLRELILAGRLRGGTRLPSTRRLAADLGVSRTVTLAACDQLASEGYLSATRGSGHYVRRIERSPVGEMRTDAAAAPDSVVPATRGKPFDPVVPAWQLFPARDWARLIARSWRRDGLAAAAFDHWGGLPSLRSAIADHLRAMQGLDCGAENVVVTNGNDDALQLVVRALGLSGDAWIEDPGHVGSRRALAGLGLRPRPVPVDDDGLDVAAGRRTAPDARLALVTPSRQFPLGMPLSLPRRLALIDWARGSGAMIVEDDYDSELRFAGRPMASLLGLDPSGSVIAIGSFSKLTFAGLRLGYAVGPAQSIARMVAARERGGVPAATSAQPALAAFIAEGGFARHLGVLRRTIAQRRAVLIDAVGTLWGERVRILPQEVGMHLTVVLRRPVPPGTDVTIAARAADLGLDVEPLSAHAFGAGGRQGFLLGYAAWDDAVLVEGVQRLAQLTRD